MKNNKDFIPTPKPPRKEKKEKKKRNVEDWMAENITAGLNGEENDYGLSGMEMQMNEKTGSSSQNTHHHKHGDSSATEFGVEITNTASHGGSAIHATVSGSSPRSCKRLYTVVEDENEYDDNITSENRTSKKVKITGLEELDSSVSEDEVEVEVWKEKMLPITLKERDIVASS